MTDRREPASSPGSLTLREVREADLPVFFEHQSDPEANRMAAFTAKDPEDRDAFMDRWAKILGDESIAKKTVLLDGAVVGHVLGFEHLGRPEVSYWIGKQFWGRGLATRALALLLDLLETRPLFARAATDNRASIRVLEKCGFRVCGQDRGFANARGEQIDEVILELAADSEPGEQGSSAQTPCA